MATEKRLIDAYALSEKIGNMKFEITHNRGGYRYCNEDEKNEWDKLDSFDSLVCDAPTVDAVEVVRCKDCRFYRKPFCILNDNKNGWLNHELPEHFCSHGERETDG